MNGKITFIETGGPDRGKYKTFTESFTRDIMFGKIFQKFKWEQIEANIVPEDRKRARELYEDELAQFTAPTNIPDVQQKRN